ncbi:MAG TPA: chemotaxis protein CheW [Bryobacteraceae bacterium]|nr:chemotaxis protein CheW [Bryobacteraceae bacterium]
MSADTHSMNALGAEATEPGQSSLLVSTFYVNGVLFALDTALVEEVVRPRRTTRVPHSPAHVLGIMNLRGKIVAVLDLARILELGKSELSDDSRLYIVPDRDGTAGLLVDRAAEVIELDESALEPAPSSVGASQNRFLRGIARAGGRLVTVLDAAAILAAENA